MKEITAKPPPNHDSYSENAPLQLGLPFCHGLIKA
jgi:hypothetical protein